MIELPPPPPAGGSYHFCVVSSAAATAKDSSIARARSLDREADRVSGSRGPSCLPAAGAADAATELSARKAAT